MAFVAAAMISGGASGIAGLGGAYIQSEAAKDAAQKQADAANHAADLQYQMYQQQRSDQEPWRQAGIGALGQMQDPSFQHDFSMSDFQQDPGYAFRMQQGQKALEASAAARGGLLGGNMGQALAQYGQDYASGEYQNAYNRFTNNQTNRFNRLGAIAGVGQTANNALGSAGQNYANQAGGAYMGAGNAAGASRIAQGNAWGGALSNLGSQGANTWMQSQYMNKMFANNNNLSGIAQPSGGGGSYGGYAGSDAPAYGEMG